MEPVWGVERGDRSQSAPLGVALVFAIAMMGMAAVVVMSAGAITETEDQIAVDRAEQTLTQLDAEMAKVALGNTDSQAIELGSAQNSYTVDADEGWIKVKRSGGSDPLGKTSLGTITYERGDLKLSYQGGGVWKKSPDGGTTMVSPPEFHFRDGTLTLPVIALAKSDGSIDGRANIDQSGPPNQKFPTSSKTNPVSEGVTVVVKSEYYEAWGSYFEERTEGIVEYEHDKNKAKLELVTPIGNTKMTNGLAALSSNGEFKIRGTGAKPGNNPVNCPGLTGGFKVLGDSYDSDSGEYCSSRQNSGGDVVYGGSIDVGGSGNSDHYGMFKTDTLKCSNCNNLDVHGEVRANTCSYGSCSQLPALPTDYYTTASVGLASSIDGHVDRKVSAISGEHDNTDPGVPISSNALTFSGGSAELGPGTYYLNQIDLSGGKTLKLDTSKNGGGDITIAVKNYVNVKGGKIKVEGTNTDQQVELFIKGESTISGTYHLNVGNGGRVLLPNDKSYRLEFLGKSDFKADISGGGGNNAALFEGLIYAPIGSSGTGEVYLEKAQVFGGIVTGDTEINVQSAVHYDQALKNKQVVNPNAKVAKITYLHISVNEVEVSG